MKWITTLTLSALAAVSMAQYVTVTVHRVRQLDDLDKSTLFITKDRADFKAQIWIDGKMWMSKPLSDDDGHPYWTFTARARPNAHIRIKLIEDDGGLERKDDFVDINPTFQRKDLHLMFNQNTGRISGDLRGRQGQIIRTAGGGDSSKGELWFSITSG